MREYLGSFDSDLSGVVQPANLGSYSLQTTYSIFWVHDTIFAKVLIDDFGMCGLHLCDQF